MTQRITHLAIRVGKRRPFASPQQEAYLNLVRTHAALTAPFEHLMRAHGISQPLYNILRILRGHLARDLAAAGAHEGVPVLRIRDEMVTREPDMTRLLARLEAAGLVSRARCERDRRIMFVAITPRGLSLLEAIEPDLDALHRSQFRRLSREQLATLNELLFLAAERGEAGPSQPTQNHPPQKGTP